MATIKFQPPRGEAHHFAQVTEAQVAHAKRMLVDARRVEVLAQGELERIAKEAGISMPTLLHVKNNNRWTHVQPAPAETEDA